MTEFMDKHFRYLKAGKKEYTEEEVRTIIDGVIATEREWVGLTDDEINAAWGNNLSFARAIEAKLKEKNSV
jgi:hypothetical protein